MPSPTFMGWAVNCSLLWRGWWNSGNNDYLIRLSKSEFPLISSHLICPSKLWCKSPLTLIYNPKTVTVCASVKWSASLGRLHLQVEFIQGGWDQDLGKRKMTPQLSCEKTCGYFWRSKEGGDNGVWLMTSISTKRRTASSFIQVSPCGK